MPSPELVLHVVPPSHPCMTVEVARRLKGLAHKRVVLTPGAHNDEVGRIYGEGRRLPGASPAGWVPER